MINTREIFGLHNNQNNLHHAYAVIGDRQESRSLVENLITDVLDTNVRSNSDVRFFESDTYTIEHARLLKSDHYLKPIGRRSIYIASFDSITTEAQQSLLKVTEDPVANVHFFFLMPSLQGVLLTLRSRLLIIDLFLLGNMKKMYLASQFLGCSPAERLDLNFIKQIIENKDKKTLNNLLEEIELISSRLLENNQIKQAQSLSSSISMRGFLNTRAPSVKMILEHLALTLPVVKPAFPKSI